MTRIDQIDPIDQAQLSAVTGGTLRNALLIGRYTIYGGLLGAAIGAGVAKLQSWYPRAPRQECIVAPPGSPIAGFPLCIVR